MAVTINQLEELESSWVQTMREFGINDEQIAINLGYILVKEN